MSAFSLSDLRNSSVWAVYRIKERIEMDPVYQREGDIWPLDKRQLLIDTIINQFDVPKIYLHKYAEPKSMGARNYDYSVIDGKQRLSAIFDFIDGNLALGRDFEYMRDTQGNEEMAIASLTYSAIAKKYPTVKSDFDAYPLDIVCIETSDVELIEELFSRLNEAVPLSAPEKRNALPGPLPAAVRQVAKHDFFVSRLPFSNRRYRHLDFAAKMLLAAYRDTVVDTKKAYIDRFFGRGGEIGAEAVAKHVEHVESVLTDMCLLFAEKDPLLRQVSMSMLYFYIFYRARSRGLEVTASRADFITFNEMRSENRLVAERDIADADYELLEFDRYTQSPNDAIAMRFRLGVLDRELFGGALGFTQVEAQDAV